MYVVYTHTAQARNVRYNFGSTRGRCFTHCWTPSGVASSQRFVVRAPSLATSTPAPTVAVSPRIQVCATADKQNACGRQEHTHTREPEGGASPKWH